MIDLSQEFHPQPKVYKSKKMPNPIAKIGKKGSASLQAVDTLKGMFEKVGIVICEIKKEGMCWRSNALTFAHLEKRRKLTVADLLTVVLACIPCHTWVEALPAEEMKKTLQEIIDKREKQP